MLFTISHSKRMVLFKLLVEASIFCFFLGCPAFTFAADSLGSPCSPIEDNGYCNHHNADSGLGRRVSMSGLRIVTYVRVDKVVNGFIVVLALMNIVVYRLRKLQDSSAARDDKPSTLSLEYPCRQFSFAEIKLATSDFDQRLVIGKGGFGTVYKGLLDHGASCAAIKRLESWSRQGASEFWTEIKMLSRVRHSHVVSLIGYCNEFNEMILVYEYVSNGNLEEHLNRKGKLSGDSPLSWVQRLKICIGAARALDYLHTGTGLQQRIIHRDVKSSNILLDENLAPKISDLGVSRIGPANQPCTHVSTEVKGSFGYFDPEYFHTGRLTRKSDVYAFGVVLLEVLTGRRAVELNAQEDQRGLVGWAKHCIKEGNLNQIIDAHLKGQISPKCLKAFSQTADKCLKGPPQERPTMAEVILNLESALALQEKMCSNNQSRIKSMILAFSRMVRNLLSPKVQVVPSTSNDNCDHASFSATSSSVDLPMVLGNNNTTANGKVLPTGDLKVYSYADLKSATRNFKSDMVLGAGGFGTVYKAWEDEKTMLPSKHKSGRPVAIKKLNPQSCQGFEEWQTEVNFLGRLSHPNLVKLLGYCKEGVDLLLVYEFMAKGSMENHLFTSNRQPLSWDLRLKIGIDAAQGLAFLHSLDERIIYRDFKTSNILLDSDYNAKLSDFGLAKMGPLVGMSHVTTTVKGSYGYAAPEYIATGHLYVKSDVYGFGIVLLEMMTGLRAYDVKRPTSQMNLVDWAKPFLSNRRKLKCIMDARIEGQYSDKAASMAAQLILKCLESEPRRRPDMKEVVEVLERVRAMKVKPK